MDNPSVMTYEQYQEKIKNLKNPADIASFAQELIAPLLQASQNAPAAPVKIGRPRLQPLARKLDRVLTPSPVAVAEQHKEQMSERELEEKVISLYGKGLTTRDITVHLKDAYGMDISTSSISAITDKVFPLVKEWQSRPLSSMYPILYMDGLWFKVRDAGKIVSKCAYIAMGINEQGYKEVLGIWIAETEGAKLWLQMLGEIKNRGVESVLIACVDGLKGFPDAIKTIFPEAIVQTCVVHMIRHTIKFVSTKDLDKFCEDLKLVYTAPTEDAGFQALEEAKKKWPQYGFYLKKWEDRWSDLSPFFSYPDPIRRVMYTTNTIENLNRQLRKVTKTTTIFPHDEALLKLLWLAQEEVARKWTLLTVRNWGEIITQFTILFPDKVQIAY